MKPALLVALAAAHTCSSAAQLLLVFSASGPAQSRDGQLSGNGLRMGYLFGKYLRGRFPDFFPARFDHKGSHVVASAADRCKQYAEATMLGVYDLGSLSAPLEARPEFALPPWKGVTAQEGLSSPLPHGYQPVPVHSFNAEDNHVFEAHEPRVCPLIAAQLKALRDAAAELERFAKALLPQLKQQFNYESVHAYVSHEDFRAYWEHLRAQKYLGAPLVDEPLLRQLENLAALSLLRSFARAEARRFALTPLLRLLDGHLADAEAGLPARKRFVLAVGHETSLFLLQALLGRTSEECLLARVAGREPEGECAGLPQPGASFAVELLGEEHGALYASFFINGKREAFCGPRAEEPCTLADFRAKLASLTLPGPLPVLMSRYCREPPGDHNRHLLVLVAFNVALGLFLLYFVLRLRRNS